MNNREKLGEIPDPNSAEWAQWFGASVDLTVVASVVSSLCFLCLHLTANHPPSCSPQSYMTSIYNVFISLLSFESPSRLTSCNLSLHSTSSCNHRVPQISLSNSLPLASRVATHASTRLLMPSARSSTLFSRTPLSSEAQRKRLTQVVSFFRDYRSWGKAVVF